MAIDIKKLRAGEKVTCDACNKGVMIPAYGAPADKAPQFICDNCGEKLTFILGAKKKKRFRTVWQKDTPESTPRIITAHREDG